MFRPVLFLLLLPLAAVAQIGRPASSPSPAAPPDRATQPMWRATLPGGTYTVALRTVTSVSTHEYIVDGIARVTEMTVDTTGSVIGRFYYLEPLVPNAVGGATQETIQHLQSAIAEASSLAGQEEVWKKVIKNYPTTTHAHTVEYRLDSLDDVNKLFASAEKAFRQNTDTNFTLK